jgi:hypothetical protein
MFSLETANIEKAITNAKALHPKVKMLEFGTYEVTGSRENTYTVRCYRKAGEKIVECSCATRPGVACKHGMAACSLHIAMAAQRGH